MRKSLLAVLVGLGLTGALRADPVTEALFAEGIFDDLPYGQEITYGHARTGPAVPDFKPVSEGRILLVTGQAEDGARSLSLAIEEGGQQREIVDFPASGGNPVLMVFLESTVRSMAAISGGSPFYIRNRIKDALRQGGDLAEVTQDFAGGAVVAQEVTLRPFESDPNRERMGEFAGLSLRFVVSDRVPGHFLSLSADTPEATTGYHETITLTDAGEGGQ
jgi:hypothetical protein